MAKKDAERLTGFISVVFKPSDELRIRAVAERKHMKVSAFIRQVVLENIETKRGKK